MIARVLVVVALLVAAITAWLGFTQQSSFSVGEEEPAMYWPQSDVVLLRSWTPTRGLVVRASRTDWAEFSDGGPGGGGK